MLFQKWEGVSREAAILECMKLNEKSKMEGNLVVSKLEMITELVIISCLLTAKLSSTFDFSFSFIHSK